MSSNADGKYIVVAGHFYGDKTANEAIAREVFKEAGIKIDPENIVLAHITHMIHFDGRESFIFTTNRFEGTTRNIVPYVRNVIEQISEK